jgi:hypothetical protein
MGFVVVHIRGPLLRDCIIFYLNWILKLDAKEMQHGEGGRACKWKCIPESNGKATPTFKHVEKRGGKGGGLSVYLERPEDSGRRRRTTKKKEYHAQ